MARPVSPAPQIAIDYWELAPDATLRDVIIAVRADEAAHRDMNHGFVDVLDERKCATELLGDKPNVGKPPGPIALAR